MKNKHNRAQLIFIALVSVLSGCGNPTDANNDNFIKVIDEYYSKPENCIYEPLFYRENGRKEKNIWSHFPLQFYSKGLDLSLFENLKDAGLLIKTKVYSNKKEPGVGYDLTEEGKKHVSTRQGSYGRYSYYGSVCVGQRKVHKITSFTAPSNFMGHTVTFVQYSSTISINDWAKDLNIVKTFDLNKEEEEILEGKIQEGEKKTLVLMSDGWVVDS